MFNAKDLLETMMRGAAPQPATARPGSGQATPGGGDLADLLGQLLRGGAGAGAPQPNMAPSAQPGAAPGGSLQDILGGLFPKSNATATGGPDGGGAGGGLADILAKMQQQGTQGAGGLADILGNIFGQATQGVREGAQRIDEATGASGRARDAIGQATGQSPDELLAKLKELIANNQLATGAGLGTLGALVLGTSTGRSIAGSAVQLGALALIGGLAYKAYQNYQQGRPLIAGRGAQAAEAAPAGSGFEAQAATHDAAVGYIRAMIAAAASDGRLDAKEQARIVDSLKGAGLDAEAEEFLAGELNNPATVDDLAAAVSSPAEAIQLYTAARVAIEPDTAEENAFLAALAGRLGIDRTLAAHIDASAAAAR
jgi:uncharacterized membrane protein YebE (DUF533 family)